ncbi:MAG: glutamine--fructose-6-phosphate transaminase (isomerizing) [Anaerolineae bacterium]|nr:glutamine--fructose-6-phosphate transaminase (isomerizing) [Anaerolineae bacterium]
MCGIVGYVGKRKAAPIIISGLRKLEYRGYDSSGIALLGEKEICIERATGKLVNLESRMTQSPNSPRPLQVGVGHTRWATHGGVTEANAHPHISMDGDVAVVHNGIVENFVELKHELMGEGVEFKSETDTEVIVHLVARYLKQNMNLEAACHTAFAQLRGSEAIVVVSMREPDKLIAARLGNAGGVVVGLGDGEGFVASDVPGILENTRQCIFLEDGEVVVVAANGSVIRKLNGDVIQKQVHTIAWDPISAEKGEYRHFMQKEMFEQARAITDTIRGRVNFETGEVSLPELKLNEVPSRIYTVASGTSLHSGMVGKFIIEKLARVSVETDYSSEFRYRAPMAGPGMAVLGITQSGETADTLAAMASGREQGANVWAIVNAIGSQAERVADGFIPMRTGPEISVCSTKTFVASIVDQYLLACALAQSGRRTADDGRSESSRPSSAVRRPDLNPFEAAKELAHLPNLVGQVLEANSIYEELANLYHDREHMLFLGRGINYPVALEGALKLKEISYIHAEGYPAGEMKHGPIALIDERMPVICIAVRDSVYEKMVSQIEQVRARHGIVIVVATEGDTQIAKKADHVIWVPEVPELLTPVITTIPMQRLAYEFALRRGCDVDQPRNLAKSVTVE